jgi:hypothetical protein
MLHAPIYYVILLQVGFYQRVNASSVFADIGDATWNRQFRLLEVIAWTENNSDLGSCWHFEKKYLKALWKDTSVARGTVSMISWLFSSVTRVFGRHSYEDAHSDVCERVRFANQGKQPVLCKLGQETRDSTFNRLYSRLLIFQFTSDSPPSMTDSCNNTSRLDRAGSSWRHNGSREMPTI